GALLLVDARHDPSSGSETGTPIQQVRARYVHVQAIAPVTRSPTYAAASCNGRSAAPMSVNVTKENRAPLSVARRREMTVATDPIKKMLPPIDIARMAVHGPRPAPPCTIAAVGRLSAADAIAEPVSVCSAKPPGSVMPAVPIARSPDATRNIATRSVAIRPSDQRIEIGRASAVGLRCRTIGVSTADVTATTRTHASPLEARECT